MTITLAVYCILPKLVWVLYNLLYNPCEGGELIVCLALTVLCCTGTTQILFSFGTMYQRVSLHCALMDFSTCLC